VRRSIAAVALVLCGALLAALATTLLGALMIAAVRALRGVSAGGVWADRDEIAAVAIFAGTYFVVATGAAPGLRLDRAGAALVGASLMVAFGVLTLDEAYGAVDFDTITLLLGMMIVVANLRLSGFFRIASNVVVSRARHPLALLAAIVLVCGAFSAFLVNDAICLVMTPLVLDLVRRLKRDPVPYLLAVPLAANIGSVATITGNPQNMIVGGLSHIPYGVFAAALWPVATAGLLATIILLALGHPREFLTRAPLPAVALAPARAHGFLAVKSVIVTLAMMILFFAGQPVAKVAIVGGAALLLTRHVKAGKVYREIDWPLLLMFVGLFIVVTGLERSVLTPERVAAMSRLDLNMSPTLAAVAAALSNLVSNVPAVLVLKPFVAGTADPERAWLVVAMATTLAGNFTLVGSVANLIVVERARAAGIAIGFWAYFKIGAPLALLTIAFGAYRLA
jgi:Na+/H+ antiporter NhaD/arsenite permease-like protein